MEEMKFDNAIMDPSLKKYIGKKTVYAEEMSEMQAVELGYARANTDGHEWRNGFHVRYNNPDGSTYDSWSPYHVFKEAYKIAETFINRMEIELKELNERFSKLSLFIESIRFVTLTPEEKHLLLSQKRAMEQYIADLGRRITLAYKHQDSGCSFEKKRNENEIPEGTTDIERNDDEQPR